MKSRTEREIEHWLQQAVVGLQLCPFAVAPFQQQRIRIAICSEELFPDMMEFFLRELALLSEAECAEIETSLLVFENGLDDFFDFLDFAETATQLLEESGAEGLFQIATFHPNYVFDGNAPNDRTNFTNRSPFPVLHLIREDELERAVQSYPQVELIPERNCQRLLGCSEEEMKAIFGSLFKS